MKDIFANRPKEWRWRWVVPFVAVFAVFLTEMETPEIRVAPSLLTIALAVFALFLSPRAVMWWAVALFVPIVLTLVFVPNNGVYETLPFVALRSAAYAAVAWVAVGLSRYRWDSERRLQALLSLFDSLKTPIVVSDIDGNILFANKACCRLLGSGSREITDSSFFTAFSQPDQRGKAIERYLRFFEGPDGGSSSMVVSIQGNSSEYRRDAVCSTIVWDRRKLLVTQID